MPVLGELQRALEHLAIMEPAPPKKDLVMEQVSAALNKEIFISFAFVTIMILLLDTTNTMPSCNIQHSPYYKRCGNIRVLLVLMAPFLFFTESLK